MKLIYSNYNKLKIKVTASRDPRYKSKNAFSSRKNRKHRNQSESRKNWSEISFNNSIKSTLAGPRRERYLYHVKYYANHQLNIHNLEIRRDS